MYIVIEGQDGTGKSTQARILAEYFKGQGREVLVMDEPDGDLVQAHDLHDMILTRNYDLEPMTNVLLFTAARLELWRKLAEPVLRRGGVVISARNWWSTLAYQGYGEGVSKSKIISLTKRLLPEGYTEPDFGVILTTTDAVRLARQGERGKTKETFEARADDFQQRVNHAYPKIAAEFGVKTLDASGTIEEVATELKKLLKI